MYRPPSLPAPPRDPSLTNQPKTTPTSPQLSGASQNASRSVRSPPPQSTTQSRAHSYHFDVASIRPHVRSLLAQHFSPIDWDRDKGDRLGNACRNASVDIKTKMIQVQPEGFKYTVTIQVARNCGQTVRADLACHWDEASDAVLSEVYSNDSVVCTAIAFAIRVAY